MACMFKISSAWGEIRGLEIRDEVAAKDYGNNPGIGLEVFSSVAQSSAPGRGLFYVTVIYPKFFE